LVVRASVTLIIPLELRNIIERLGTTSCSCSYL
jgi:hypothetical protein